MAGSRSGAEKPDRVRRDRGAFGAATTTRALGTIVAGAYVKDSVVGQNVFIDAGADVRDSVVMDNVRIGRGARVRRAIIDKNFALKDGDHIGYDPEYDRKRFHVSETGIVVVPRSRNPSGDASGSHPRLRRVP